MSREQDVDNDQQNDSVDNESSSSAKTTAKRYVPPHLRGKPEAARDLRDNFKKESRYNDDSNGYDEDRGFRSSRERGGPPPRTPSGRFDRSDPRPSTKTRKSDDFFSPATTKRDEFLEKQLFSDVKTGIDFDKYEDIPVETSGRDIPKAITSFTELTTHEIVKHNIQLAGYERPTPVQKYACSISLKGRDLMGCAQTGSGKTAAFLFPLISLLMTEKLPLPPREERYSRRRKAYPYALILAPTRELATQIYKEALKFTYRTGLRAVVVYGGQEIRHQLRELEMGVDIMVATPGRLVDMIERGRVSLSLTNYLILDEADRMLDMGFEPQIRQIVEQQDMPRDTRQTSMFSATFPKEIQILAQDFLTDYIFLAVGRVGSATENVTQKVEYVDERDKKDKLMEIIPECEGLTLIFVETKRNADSLEDFLLREDINATSIHGDRSQQQRETALAVFRAGRCPILVATSVAARGLDIPDVKHVINYDCPNNIEDYVHRIGRTGRAGHRGTSITFIDDQTRILRELYDMFKENKQKIDPWFEKMVQAQGYGWGGSRGGRGGGKKRGGSSRYATRDYRQSPGFSRSMQRGGGSGDSWGGSSAPPRRGGSDYESGSTGSSSRRGRGRGLSSGFGGSGGGGSSASSAFGSDRGFGGGSRDRDAWG